MTIEEVLNIPIPIETTGSWEGSIINKAVVSPNHYCTERKAYVKFHEGKHIEVIDTLYELLTLEEFIGYCKGNVIKYQGRYANKGKPVEDLDKASVYAKWAADVIRANNY